ncbi:hypothetical protein [Methylotuvimicrobium sp.]|uniref:hypothetical protein n=1 Tax=Methylotuvimicrobium sp. TaxID=2822413 RepID=UPI003D6598AB
MLKIKAPLKKLSAAVALGLFAGTASASVSIYDTFPFGYSGGESLVAPFFEDGEPDWAAGRFTVDPFNCPNGCLLDSVRLSLASGGHFSGDLVSLKDSSGNYGISLAVYSNNFLGGDTHIPGDKLFDLSIPDSFVQLEHFGGNDVWFDAPSQDPNEAALLQPNTAYWLFLTNESLSFPIEWSYNGAGHDGQYYAAYWNPLGAHGSPYLFEVMGTSCTTCSAPVSNVPVPGAIWLMGTAMIGLVTSWRRKLA